MSAQPGNYEPNRDNYDLTKLFETEMEAKERRASERLQFIMYNFQDKNNRYYRGSPDNTDFGELKKIQC